MSLVPVWVFLGCKISYFLCTLAFLALVSNRIEFQSQNIVSICVYCTILDLDIIINKGTL